MKTITKIFAGLAVLGTMAACQMYEIDTQMTPEKAAASIRMECSAVDTYNLPAQNPGNITFNVSSNTPWTITLSSGADWLTVSPASSASSALITDVVVSAQNNTGTTDRSATLTLRGDNIANAKTIVVKQARAGKLFVTPMVSDYSAAGGPLSFTIQTNQPWEVRSSEGWLTFNRENGEPDPDGRTLTIIATAAASNVIERTATVTVVAGDDEESFDVVQKGTFIVTELSEAFGSEGGAKTFTIKTDLPWEVSADKTWLTFDETSGTGDGSVKTITATAAANDGALRKTVVTVSAGGVDKTFEVSQNGFTFEIVAPASTELAGAAATLTLEVNTSLEWTPSTEVAGWTVEKTDAKHFTVTAGWNGLFAPKVGTVAIDGAGGAHNELELTQACNFTVEGNAEVQEDGSVKIMGGGSAPGRVKIAGKHTYLSAVLKMGTSHFGDKAQFYFVTHDAGPSGNGEIENRITLDDMNGAAPENIRLRANAQPPVGSKASGSGYYVVTKDDLNAMTEYRVDFVVNSAPADPAKTFLLAFYYNGTELGRRETYDFFGCEGYDMSGNYWFGYNKVTTDDDTWYVVKSCDITFFE